MGDERRTTLVLAPSDSSLGDLFVRELERLGHDVLAAFDWQDALVPALIQVPDAVVCDPGLTAAGGPTRGDVLAQLAARRPGLIVVELREAKSAVGGPPDQTAQVATIPPPSWPAIGTCSITVRDGDWPGAAREVDRLSRWTLRRRGIAARFNRLHVRLLTGSGDERAEIKDAIHRLVQPELIRELDRRCGPCADRQDVLVTAAADAVMKYFEKPALCEPGAGDPVAWFKTVATNKMLDILRQQKRRAAVERPAGVDVDFERSVPLAAQRPDDEAEARHSHTAELLERLLPSAWTDSEKRYLRLKFGGGSIAEQAAALGAGDGPESKQRAAVQAAWHRIKQRAVRTGVITARRAKSSS